MESSQNIPSEGYGTGEGGTCGDLPSAGSGLQAGVACPVFSRWLYFCISRYSPSWKRFVARCVPPPELPKTAIKPTHDTYPTDQKGPQFWFHMLRPAELFECTRLNIYILTTCILLGLELGHKKQIGWVVRPHSLQLGSSLKLKC